MNNLQRRKTECPTLHANRHTALRDIISPSYFILTLTVQVCGILILQDMRPEWRGSYNELSWSESVKTKQCPWATNTIILTSAAEIRTLMELSVPIHQLLCRKI